MRSYRSFSLVIAVLLCLSALSSCTPSAPRNDFAYADTPFSCSVEGTYLPASDPDGAPRPIAATVTAGAPVNGEPLLRELTVTFTSPAALAGVTVAAALSPAPDGTPARSVTFAYPSDYGDVRVTAKGDEFDGLLRFAEALLPVGDIANISPMAENGTRTVTRKTGDGAREAVFVFAEGQTLPTEVTVTDRLGRLELAVQP